MEQYWQFNMDIPVWFYTQCPDLLFSFSFLFFVNVEPVNENHVLGLSSHLKPHGTMQP